MRKTKKKKLISLYFIKKITLIKYKQLTKNKIFNYI